ncbi:MAG: hypothetical protein AOA65_1172 [Candidatus Bathyarchaeota archaeon BA1]|nr:MAG: hypothetical protein AOA65_1172 [Candidatus Bathyarchaeota archaeon BA1]
MRAAHVRGLQRAFGEKALLRKLRVLLVENRGRWPLTDLYLTHPLLRSRGCTEEFRQVVLKFIEEKSGEDICRLVNSATSTLLTYILVGGEKDKKWVQDTMGWLKQQQLKDGGWHWKPKGELPLNARSEAWSTAMVFAALKTIDGANTGYMDAILEFLKRDWKERGWGGSPEVTMIYLSIGGINGNNRIMKEAIQPLRASQLPNGAWPGYSRKTCEGGIFKTCVILNALTAAGLGLNDESVLRGLKFVESKIDRILNARWGGVLIQGLCSLASALLRLGLID